MQTILRVAFSLVVMLCGLNTSSAADANDLQSLGVGHEHMDISCSPAVSRNFDMALALLHNFWYPRALSRFDQVIQVNATRKSVSMGGDPSHRGHTGQGKYVLRGLKQRTNQNEDGAVTAQPTVRQVVNPGFHRRRYRDQNTTR